MIEFFDFEYAFFHVTAKKESIKLGEINSELVSIVKIVGTDGEDHTSFIRDELRETYKDLVNEAAKIAVNKQKDLSYEL